MIPKIVHYCWLSGDEYPELVKQCMASWKENLPGWEFRLWDKTCLPEIDNLYAWESYEDKVYALACDVILLYAVHKFGGVYMDVDVEVLKKTFRRCANCRISMAWKTGQGRLRPLCSAQNPDLLTCNAASIFSKRKDTIFPMARKRYIRFPRLCAMPWTPICRFFLRTTSPRGTIWKAKRRGSRALCKDPMN